MYRNIKGINGGRRTAFPAIITLTPDVELMKAELNVSSKQETLVCVIYRAKILAASKLDEPSGKEDHWIVSDPRLIRCCLAVLIHIPHSFSNCFHLL